MAPCSWTTSTLVTYGCFLAGAPHFIQALGECGCEFLLVFKQGDFSEESTLLLSDWLKHPPEILQQNLGLGPLTMEKLPKGEPLYIFPNDEPVKSLAQDIAKVARRAANPTISYTFKASAVAPTRQCDAGYVKIIDGRNCGLALS